MSGKFMKIKRITVPIITVLMISSQLVGCASASSKEMLNMLENQQSITIEVAEPESIEQGTQRTYEWTELASLDNYSEFRQSFDDTFGITAFGVGGKNGSVYVDLEGNQTNNSTLYYAMMNQKFAEAWDSSDTIKAMVNASKSNYADVETDAVARIAALNAYFNIFVDSEPNYFNGSSTLTRAEFMAGSFRAQNPVFDLAEDSGIRSSFESIVDADNTNENTAYAYYMNNLSYLSTDDSNLNQDTFNGTITRAEAIYQLVQLYYSDEYKATTGKESAFSDTKNGGDIAEKCGFVVTDKSTGSVTTKTYWKSYELSYALQNVDKGMPADLYRAMVVAKNHNIITTTESRWDEGLTKAEALSMIVNVYTDLDTITNADRGQATGEAINTEALQSTTSNGSLEVEEEGLGVYFNKDKIRLESDGTYTMAADTYEYLMNFNGISEIPEDKIQQFIEDISPILISGIFDDPSDLQNYITELSSIYTTPTNTTTPSNTESSSSTTETPTQTPTQAPSEPSTPAPSTPESGVDDVDYQEGLIIDYSDSGEEINMEFDDEDDPAFKIEPGNVESGYIRAK